MLEFREINNNGARFWRAEGKKHVTYTIWENKSKGKQRYSVRADFCYLSTNCHFGKAIELANKYEDNIKVGSFKA